MLFYEKKIKPHFMFELQWPRNPTASASEFATPAVRLKPFDKFKI